MRHSNKNKKRSFWSTIDKEQTKDTGMAMVLVCMIVWYFDRSEWLVLPAVFLLILNMVLPQAYKPVAVLWFGLSNRLGSMMSHILLTILFLLLVTPVGILRRWTGKDTLLLKQWKKTDTSVFRLRNHTYQPKDLEWPY